MTWNRIEVLRAPDGDAAGGGAAAGGGSQEGAAAGAAAGQAPDGGGTNQPAVPYRPEGLPDHLFGATERETIDKLFGAYKPARDRLNEFNELGKVPKDGDGYAFEPSEKLKPFLPDVGNDPAFKAARAAAHAAGIRDKQFAPFVTTLLESLVDSEFVGPPVDLAAEKAALVPADAAALDQAGKDAAVDRRVRTNHALLEVWKSRGLDAASAEALSQTLDTLAGNRAIEFFQDLTRTPQPALTGQQAGTTDAASLAARTRDPRNKVGGPKFDAAYAAETDRMYRGFYGAGEGRG